MNFRAGSPPHAVSDVDTGAVRPLRYGQVGEALVQHHAFAGEFFAEASLDNPCGHCDAVASEACTLLHSPAGALREELANNAAFARQWIALLARQLRTVRTRLERLSLKRADDRVMHLLVSEGRGPRCEFTLHGSLKGLARQLGLNHESLYRTLATLERQGAIERNGVLLRLGR